MKFSEGNKLAQDPLSGCVVIREHVQHMWLPPRYLNGRIGSGVKELLERQIGKYNESLDGIHLAYSKVKVIQRASFLLYDSVDMHFDVHYDVVIFRVYPGTLLKCTVNKVSADHLGCLIHKVINMSVPVPEWTFDPNQVKGQEMICKVTKVEYKKGVLGIYGELTEDSLATIQERFAASEEMKHEEDEMDISQNNNTIDQSAKMTEKKREKRKKKVCEDIEYQEESLSNTSQNQNDSLFTSSLSLDETPNSQNLEMQTSDRDNSNMKVKKKKKRKREDVDEIRDDEEAETLNLLDQDLLVKDEKRKKKRRKGERRDVSEDVEDLNDSGINGSSSDGHIENDDALYNDSSDGRKKKHKKKKRKIASD